MPVYADHLRTIIKEGVNRDDGYDKPLRGFHICVDAGNGGGGYFATDVLAPLGADILGVLAVIYTRIASCVSVDKVHLLQFVMYLCTCHKCPAAV